MTGSPIPALIEANLSHCIPDPYSRERFLQFVLTRLHLLSSRKMKIVSIIQFFTLASLASAGGFGNRDVNKPFAPSRLSKVLNIRGGGGTKENLVTAFTALNGLHGVVSMAAPEKVPDIFYQGTFEIEEGTLAEAYQEHCGSALAGMALLTYLATFTDMPTSSAIAWSSAPCFYSHGRRLLKTGYAKLGYKNGFDTFWYINVFLIMPIMTYAIISGNYDSDLLAKICKYFLFSLVSSFISFFLNLSEPC